MTHWLERFARYLLRSRYVGVGAATVAAAGIGISLATFAFQEAQSWVDEGSHLSEYRWALPSAVGSAVLLLSLSALLAYIAFFGKRAEMDSIRDPYLQYAQGILAYASVLHKEHRDPALIWLRKNSSITLHILGFNQERVQLGQWALEAAQFVDDKLAVVSILIDDLGWAKYLLDNPEGPANIERGIRFGEQLSLGENEPKLSITLAKAYRHLGVIKAEKNDFLDKAAFLHARQLLSNVREQSPRTASIELAHVSYAEALAIATVAGIQSGGKIRKADVEGMAAAQRAIQLIRDAKQEFLNQDDHGRFAKSLVLEVRLLEATNQAVEAAQLAILRDRAVATSIWARPAGRSFLLGK